jgi:hypothetical protein
MNGFSFDYPFDCFRYRFVHLCVRRVVMRYLLFLRDIAWNGKALITAKMIIMSAMALCMWHNP